MWYELRGMTPDEIVTQFPSITLSDVHAALAYYFGHVDEIRDDMRAEREFADEFAGTNQSLLREKLRKAGMREAS